MEKSLNKYEKCYLPIRDNNTGMFYKQIDNIEIKNGIIKKLEGTIDKRLSLYESFEDETVFFLEYKYYDGNKECKCSSFDSVIYALYLKPNKFKITDEQKEQYSNQELKYLDRLQKYFKLIKLEDVDNDEQLYERSKKEEIKKYSQMIKSISKIHKDVLNGKKEYNVLPINKENEKHINDDLLFLVIDETIGNYLGIIKEHEKVLNIKELNNYEHQENIFNNEQYSKEYFKLIEYEIIDKFE